MVEGQPEPIGDFGLHRVHFRAVFSDRLARLGRRQFRRCAVFVGGAEKQNLVPAPPQVAGVEIGGQLAAHEISKVLDPVDIGNGRGDEVAGHTGILRLGCGRLTQPIVRWQGGV